MAPLLVYRLDMHSEAHFCVGGPGSSCWHLPAQPVQYLLCAAQYLALNHPESVAWNRTALKDGVLNCTSAV